jgi:hypothetical protein
MAIKITVFTDGNSSLEVGRYFFKFNPFLLDLARKAVIGGLTHRQAKICKKKKACSAKIDKRNTEMK